jgi:hypothetical protein
LAHLCRLISRDREPYEPINGMLFLVPAAGTDSDEDAQETGDVCRRDLELAQKGLRLRCPIFTALCDLEKVPGFREFRDGFPEKSRQRRVGQRFPLAPDLEGQEVPHALERLVEATGQTMFPSWIYKFFRLERSDNPSDEKKATIENTRLYQFMGEMRQRQGRMARLLTKGLLAGQPAPWLFGGCYVAGTGEKAGEQAFLAGLLRRLYDDDHAEQNYNKCDWLPEARDEDARYHRRAKLGYTIVAALAVATVVLIGYGIFSNWDVNITPR